jgi:hypothetical protein
MIAWSVGVFIAVRVLSYIVLRLLRVSVFPAFFVTLISYDFAQQWITIKDFSIHIASLFVPFLVFVWIKSLSQLPYLYFFAALSGASWLLHPIIGYTFTALFFVSLFIRRNSAHRFYKFSIFSVFVLTFLPFPAQYFFTGYSFSNPIFSSPQFLRETLISGDVGLSLIYLLLLGVAWMITFLFTDRVPRWSKLLLLFCTVYMLVIWIGVNGYLPGFLNSLQISRAITLVGLLLPFCFAPLLATPLRMTKSKLVSSVLVAVMAVSLANSVELSSQYAAEPVNSTVNPVASYFKNVRPTGSVYYDDVSEASYFSPGDVRFVTSYNEHREGHPLAQRFKNLMHSDAAYTGVTQRQIELINAYSEVLGVEYIFLPQLSPLVDGLTKDSSRSVYRAVATVTTPKGVYSVLRNTTPIHYAYAVDDTMVKQINFSLLAQPNLYANSYKLWDEEVLKMATLVRNNFLTPVSLQFLGTSSLRVSSDKPIQRLLILQTYDDYWSVASHQSSHIVPTSLRMMYISLSPSSESTITLVNGWPVWHWPLQIFSGALCVVFFILALFFGRRNHEQTVHI